MEKHITQSHRTIRVRFAGPDGGPVIREFDQEAARSAFLFASQADGSLELYDDGVPCGEVYRNTAEGPWLISGR